MPTFYFFKFTGKYNLYVISIKILYYDIIYMLIILSICINKIYWQDIMSYQSSTIRSSDNQGNFQQTSSRVVSSRY